MTPDLSMNIVGVSTRAELHIRFTEGAVGSHARRCLIIQRCSVISRMILSRNASLSVSF